MRCLSRDPIFYKRFPFQEDLISLQKSVVPLSQRRHEDCAHGLHPNYAAKHQALAMERTDF